MAITRLRTFLHPSQPGQYIIARAQHVLTCRGLCRLRMSVTDKGNAAGVARRRGLCCLGKLLLTQCLQGLGWAGREAEGAAANWTDRKACYIVNARCSNVIVAGGLSQSQAQHSLEQRAKQGLSGGQERSAVCLKCGQLSSAGSSQESAVHA